uniref:Uncharacterized protein n=1 Tax=Sphaerodactylus townsendi TaxID=933632 RepID=A0ACB8GE37_9SAUR
MGTLLEFLVTGTELRNNLFQQIVVYIPMHALADHYLEVVLPNLENVEPRNVDSLSDWATMSLSNPVAGYSAPCPQPQCLTPGLPDATPSGTGPSLASGAPMTPVAPLFKFMMLLMGIQEGLAQWVNGHRSVAVALCWRSMHHGSGHSLPAALDNEVGGPSEKIQVQVDRAWKGHHQTTHPSLAVSGTFGFCSGKDGADEGGVAWHLHHPMQPINSYGLGFPAPSSETSELPLPDMVANSLPSSAATNGLLDQG